LARRRYSIVLADRSTGVVRRFTISLRPTLAGFVLMLTLPILVGLGARWSAQSAISDLERSSTLLRIENGSYRDATGQLAQQVASLQAAVDELGVRAAVDPAVGQAMEKLPPNVKSRAMGGSSAVGLAAPIFSDAFGAPNSTFGTLRDLLSTIETRLNSMRGGVERRRALAAATPSIWPVVGWLSSPYGARKDPFTGDAGFHPGLDISADYGEPVQATADGIVVSAAQNGNYGNLVVVEHGYGIVTKYGHLSRFAVTNGEAINRGDVIGYVGSSGRSTSPHLHYEILVNGQLTNPLKLLTR
jgi:murein DD-endopeptidase MepM/ murein hydrolase activator NlpD